MTCDLRASYLYLRVPGWATEAEIVPQWSGGAPVRGGLNGTVQRVRLPSNGTGGKAVVQIGVAMTLCFRGERAFSWSE